MVIGAIMPLRSNHYVYTRITTAATTQVKNGPTTLKRIVVNVPIAASTITIVDNISGTTPVVGVITSTADLKPYFIDFDANLSTGLRIITTNAQDITVLWS
jgi:hypothetical protein